MGMTRVEIAPEIRHKVGLPSDDKAVTDEKVFRDINAGLRKMAQDFDWPWLADVETYSLTSGSFDHILPADYVKTLWVSIDDVPLRNMQRRQLQTYTEMSGFPRAYSVFGGNLTLHPTANQDHTVTHAYVRGETFLSDDADEVLCPDSLIDIVFTYAAIETATRLKDAVLRQSLRDELTDWKRRAADNVKPTHGTYAPNVERWWI